MFMGSLSLAQISEVVKFFMGEETSGTPEVQLATNKQMNRHVFAAEFTKNNDTNKIRNRALQ